MASIGSSKVHPSEVSINMESISPPTFACEPTNLTKSKDGSLGSSLWSVSSAAGEKVLSGIDYLGLKLADIFGITSSRYEEYVWEAQQQKERVCNY
jgi:hypothetical protein